MNAPPTSQTTVTGWWTRLPLRIALAAVALVWVFGCVWSFREQTGFAESKHFRIPELLPLVVDGLAISLAAVAWAASLDGRPAIFARLATAVGVAGSAASNGAFAWERSRADTGTVLLAVAVPVAANLAFEVLLAESRRQVLRRRGLPTPVAVPYPRLVRICLAPWSTFWQWRGLVLAATDLVPLFAAANDAAGAPPPGVEADTEPDKAPAIERARRPAKQLVKVNAKATPSVRPPNRTDDMPDGMTSDRTARTPKAAVKVLQWRAKQPDMTQAQVAAKTGLSVRTVARHWQSIPPAADGPAEPANGTDASHLLPTGSR
jgi:hypothetical protein